MDIALVKRPETIAGELTSAASRGSDRGGGSPAMTDPAILAFDEQIIEGPLRRIVTCAVKIGRKILEATLILEEAFLIQKELLIKAKQIQKPDAAGMSEFLKPLTEVMVKAKTLSWERIRLGSYLEHVELIEHSLVFLLGDESGTILASKHVEESWHVIELFCTEALEESTNKDPDHEEWTKALKELYIPSLRDYVNKNYPLGPEWGPAGSAPIVPAAKPIPKAPPPPPKLPSSSSMTIEFRELSSEPATPAGSFPFKTGTPKLELLMDRRWVVENQVGKKNLVIKDCNSDQSVYAYNCKDCILEVKGEVRYINLDKCSETVLVFTDVVTRCQIMNCTNVEFRCQGRAPGVSIYNTYGLQLCLDKAYVGPGVSITSAKSSDAYLVE